MFPRIQIWSIEQAKAYPGTAIVRMIDDVTSEINTYYLNFDVKSAGDEFNGNTLGNQWQWIREDR